MSTHQFKNQLDKHDMRAFEEVLFFNGPSSTVKDIQIAWLQITSPATKSLLGFTVELMRKGTIDSLTDNLEERKIQFLESVLVDPTAN